MAEDRQKRPRKITKGEMKKQGKAIAQVIKFA